LDGALASFGLISRMGSGSLKKGWCFVVRFERGFNHALSAGGALVFCFAKVGEPAFAICTAAFSFVEHACRVAKPS